MNKCEFINAVTERTGTNYFAVREVIDAALDVITGQIKAGDSVHLRGFGTFDTVVRAGHVGRNPRTGESIDIPEKTVVRFKAGTELRKFVEE